MRAVAYALICLGLTACQPAEQSAREVSADTSSIETIESTDTTIDTGDLIGAANVTRITGKWVPRSRGAEKEFGELGITTNRVVFSIIGSASAIFKDTHALLEWTEDAEGQAGICGDGAPAAVEFRLSEKAEYLAPGTSGQVLELSFYSSATNIANDRDTNLDLCRTSIWERD